MAEVSSSLMLRTDDDAEKQRELPDFAAFAKKIFDTWRKNHSSSYPSLVEDLEHLFNRSVLPSLILVELCEKAILMQNIAKPSSLFALIVKFYSRWVGANAANTEAHSIYLDTEIQDRALQLMFKYMPTLIPQFEKLFVFDKLSVPMECHISSFLSNGEYVNAATLIIHYKLFDKFVVKEILPPLLILRQTTLIDDYLEEQPALQKEFVLWLDSLVSQKYAYLNAVVQQYNRMPTAGVDAISGKVLEKQVWRNVHRYGMSIEDVPRSKRSRCEASLRHIHFMLCSMNQLEYVQYLDHIEYALRSSKSLQVFYVSYLVRARDNTEASRWARFCNFGNRLARTSPLWRSLDLNSHDAEQFVEYMNDREHAIMRTSPVRPYQYEGFEIEFVKSMEKLAFLTDLLKATTNSVIAIDSEFRPMYITCVEKVALLQLAVNGRVFLVDTISVEDTNPEIQRLWKDFFEALFTTDDNLKIGFAFSGDMKVIMASSPQLSNLYQNMKKVSCIVKLVQAMHEKNPESITGLPANEEGRLQFKLSELTFAITGREMCKKEQLSNWDRRPLRKEQMEYAAMDVISVIEIYEKLQNLADEFKLNFADCVQESILHAEPVQKKPPTRQKRKGKVGEDELQNMIERLNLGGSDGQQKNVHDFKFICDAMLLGMGKDLRKCGIDALLCTSHLEITEAVREDSSRIIITCGKAYQKLSNMYPRNVLNIEAPSNSMSAMESLLKMMNIRVLPEDIFSRCQKCNFDHFTCVPFPLMDGMMKLSDKSLSDDERIALIQSFHPVAASEANNNIEAKLISKTTSSVLFELETGYVDVVKMEVYMAQSDGPNHLDPIQVKMGALIPAVITEDKKFFRICGKCGKVYWDGSHLHKTHEQMNGKGMFADEAEDNDVQHPIISS